MQLWLDVLLIATVAVCIVTDLLRRKIYNAVLFPVLLLAFAAQAAAAGIEGVLTAAAGLAVGLGLLLIPYLLGGIGAGDVKLLAVVGALKGAGFVLTTALYMGIIGGIVALGYVVCRRESRTLWTRFLYMLYSWRSGIRASLPSAQGASSLAMPYGVAIGGGALAALWTGGWL